MTPRRSPIHATSCKLSLVLLVLCSLGACQKPAQPQQPTAAVVDENELDALWEASLNVLRKFEFRPDRQDRAAGVITTLPTTSAQPGEFWRQDVADPYSAAEAGLHTIQRQVTVRFPRNGDRQIEVQVDVFRLSAPESQITTASSAIQAFSGILPDAEGAYQGTGRANRHWVMLGRDAALEDRLLRRIMTQAAL